MADDKSTAREIGDEPYQIKRKYPNITVAVDANRRRGIKQLKKQIPDIDVILLDDAFQHRYVTPLSSIVLTDYNRALHLDKQLPAGRLREISTRIVESQYGHRNQVSNRYETY